MKKVDSYDYEKMDIYYSDLNAPKTRLGNKGILKKTEKSEKYLNSTMKG